MKSSEYINQIQSGETRKTDIFHHLTMNPHSVTLCPADANDAQPSDATGANLLCRRCMGNKRPHCGLKTFSSVDECPFSHSFWSILATLPGFGGSMSVNLIGLGYVHVKSINWSVSAVLFLSAPFSMYTAPFHMLVTLLILFDFRISACESLKVMAEP